MKPTLQDRIDRKRLELASLKPRSERRVKVQAELERLVRRSLQIQNIIDEIAA